MILKGVRAYFFDFDGTLVNTTPALYRVYSQFLQEKGFQGSLEEFSKLSGPPLREVVAFLKQKYALETSIEELFDEYVRGVSKEYLQKDVFFPGARAFLEQIKGAGYPIALVTGAPKRFVLPFLEGERATSLFDAIITADDVRLGKPSPEGYLKAYAQLSAQQELPLEECMAFEDSASGALAALAASLPLIWMNHFSSQESYQAHRSLSCQVPLFTSFEPLSACLADAL
ncbi:MAG: phosphoglycolate phosphatase [Chlamydiales bacterium]|jgi:HAD superfamily hydrolase (TIGR01509 family)|nr:phosphoglycolate phosphatase [Chlamydiales bacterium]